jgi:hypothetical protein
MGPDGNTSGPGSLHSWPVLSLQGQLKGLANEMSKMVARGRCPRVVLAEGDRWSHQSAASGGGEGPSPGDQEVEQEWEQEVELQEEEEQPDQ